MLAQGLLSEFYGMQVCQSSWLVAATVCSEQFLFVRGQSSDK